MPGNDLRGVPRESHLTTFKTEKVELSIVSIPILQMKKLKPRKIL